MIPIPAKVRPYLIPVACAVGGIVAGTVVARYTLPPRVQEKVVTKVEWKDRVEWRERVVKEQGPVRIVTRTVTVPGPQGPTVTVEKVVEKEKVVTQRVEVGREESQGRAQETASRTEDRRPWVAVEALGAVNPQGEWAGAGSVQFRVLGPLWVGPGVIKANGWFLGAAGRVEF